MTIIFNEIVAAKDWQRQWPNNQFGPTQYLINYREGDWGNNTVYFTTREDAELFLTTELPKFLKAAL